MKYVHQCLKCKYIKILKNLIFREMILIIVKGEMVAGNTSVLFRR